jgi:hypothetical protein
MFHSNTERLIEYWRARKVGLASPLRASIDPTELASLLPQVFILGRDGPGRCLFRLAGGLLTDLHQRDLRHQDWLSLWDAGDRLRLATSAEVARRHGEPIILLAEGRTASGRKAGFEILLAPLRGGNGQADRFIGLYQPTTPLSALLSEPLATLCVQSVASAAAPVEPYLKLASVDGRRIA